MPKACPNCGETEVRVYSLDLARSDYDLQAQEWSGHTDLLGEHFTTEALCKRCDADLTLLIPGERLSDEVTVKELIRVANIAKEYIEARLPDAVDHTDQELVDCLEAAIRAVPQIQPKEAQP